MRALVDKDTCIGCGLCEGTCPEVFRINEEGTAETYADTTNENHEAVLVAAEGCPTGAIHMEE